MSEFKVGQIWDIHGKGYRLVHVEPQFLTFFEIKGPGMRTHGSDSVRAGIALGYTRLIEDVP